MYKPTDLSAINVDVVEEFLVPFPSAGISFIVLASRPKL